MSTFNGRLQNPLLNFIAIDNFTEKNHDASVFFLSHAHADHLSGFHSYGGLLFNSKNGKTLFCTHTTKRLLQIKYFKITDDCVVTLEVGETTILQTPVKNEDEESFLVSVTVLPTLHILGSVMFLFKCQDISALYTGDFRLHTGEVSKIKTLHDEDDNSLKITDLYLDTTFADEKHIWFPERDVATAKIIELSEEWLDQSEKNHVGLILSSYYGYEHLLMELSKALNTKILVDDSNVPHFKYIPEMDNSISYFKNDIGINLPSKRPKLNSKRLGRVHVCRLSRSVSCNLCSGIVDLARNFRGIKPCAFSFHLKSNDYDKFFHKYGINNYKVAYSNHCSLTELQYFTNYLKPTNIYPSVIQDPNSCERILELLCGESKEVTHINDNSTEELSLSERDADSESDKSTGFFLDSPPI